MVPHAADVVAALPSGQILVAGGWTYAGRPESDPWAGFLDLTTGMTTDIATPERIAFEVEVLTDGTTVLAGGLSPLETTLTPDDMTWAEVLR